MEQVAFFAGAIGALGGAVAVIALRNPFYSVLALVVHLFSLAGLFLILHAEFVAAAQVVVYAGGVMVLYVFVAAYVGGFGEPLWDAIPGQRILAPLLGAALFIELSIAVIGTALSSLESDGPTIPLGFGTPEQIGETMLEDFLIPFEAASMLLLIAAVGAVVLAARRPPLPNRLAEADPDHNPATLLPAMGGPDNPANEDVRTATAPRAAGVGGGPLGNRGAGPETFRDEETPAARRNPSGPPPAPAAAGERDEA